MTNYEKLEQAYGSEIIKTQSQIFELERKLEGYKTSLAALQGYKQLEDQQPQGETTDTPSEE